MGEYAQMASSPIFQRNLTVETTCQSETLIQIFPPEVRKVRAGPP